MTEWEYQSTKQAGLIALGLSKYKLNQKLNSLVEWECDWVLCHKCMYEKERKAGGNLLLSLMLL